MIKRRNYYHQNIKYAFNWNFKHHQNKLLTSDANHNQFKKLQNYFKKVATGAIPNSIFNNKNMARVSQFKIKGLKSAFLRSFSKQLIRAGKITRYDSKTKLPNYAQKVYENYETNHFNKKPGHDPVLKNILIKDKDSIAIEVPIWKQFKEDIFLTGHIDLIQIRNNELSVIDYKPEGNFLISLPQVSIYGLLLQKIIDIDKLKCISFNKDEAWEYDPNILLTDIKNYLESKRLVREWEKYL